MKIPMQQFFWSILLAMLITFTPLAAVSGEGTGFSTTIIYQNVGLDVAHVTILYYPEGQSTPVTISRPDLPIGATASVSIGNIDTSPASFKGSAVIKSDVEIAVVMTQIPTTVSVKARPMAAAASKGSPTVWLLPVIKVTGFTSFASVQNLDNKPADMKFTFYGGTQPFSLTKSNIPAGGAAYIDLSEVSELGSVFVGSILVESTRSGSTTTGKITGMSFYSSGTNTGAAATESLTSGGTKIYMPMAMCNSTGGMSSSYYVFNTDPTQTAAVRVTYNSGKFEDQSLPARTGRYFNACNPKQTASGYNGYAVITSNGPALLAVGTIKQLNMSATYTGQTTGASKLALPYAHYSTAYFANGQRDRTTISVQNLGGNLAAGAVKARYYGKDGSLVGTVTFPAFAAGGKIDTSAAQLGAPGAEFGYYSDGSTGGSVVIEGPAGSSLMAVAWVLSLPSAGLYSGEMYNGIAPIGSQ